MNQQRGQPLPRDGPAGRQVGRPKLAEGCIAEHTDSGYLFMQGWQTRQTHYRLQVKGFIPMEAVA